MAVFKAENLHNIRGDKILMGKEKRALLLHEELSVLDVSPKGEIIQLTIDAE